MQLADAGWQRSRQEIQAVESWLCGMVEAAAVALASCQTSATQVPGNLLLRFKLQCWLCEALD